MKATAGHWRYWLPAYIGVSVVHMLVFGARNAEAVLYSFSYAVVGFAIGFWIGKALTPKERLWPKVILGTAVPLALLAYDIARR